MALWTNQYLIELSDEAEAAIADEIPCIIDRYSLEVFSGLVTYQLPEYVSNIRRIFYKGFRLDPVSSTGFNIYDEIGEDGAFAGHAFTSAYNIDGAGGSSSSAAAAGGRPFEYYYSTFGENVIRFFPGIPENLAAYSSGLYAENIGNAVIIEFYRTPDGVNHKIPEYIRRRTIKAYVLSKAFQKEGDGQNLQAAQYWKGQYTNAINKARNIINDVYSAAARHRESGGYMHINRPARPVLPPNYGIVVEDYEY